jgi:hypothetical protein
MVIEQALRSRAALLRDDPHSFCERQQETLNTWVLLTIDICGEEATAALLSDYAAAVPQIAAQLQAARKAG